MPSLSVVMPLYNAEKNLPLVLPPLLAALKAGELEEIIVVDDGSTDAGPEICRQAGLRVLVSPGRLGPGARRNQGVKVACSDVVLFVDSDVVIHRDVPVRMAQVFAEQMGCVAVFGSYDDRPHASGWVSQYRNLLHHYVHQNGSEEARTFWAGCGAVNRQAFLSAGGFDIRRYPHSSIEDIELGHRLCEGGGRVLLRPEIQSKHLKKWTFTNMIFTDIYRRAIPWARLTLQPGYAVNDLNLSLGEKVRALVAVSFWMFLLLSAVQPLLLVAVALLLGGAWLSHRRFFGLVRRRCGTVSMVAAVFLQQLHYLYGGFAYLVCRVDGTSRLSASLARINALSMAAIFGVVAGISLWLATVTLVVQAGPMTGKTLGLLSQYFPGYSVTMRGAFIGMAWAMAAGFVLALAPAWLYYRGVVIDADGATHAAGGPTKATPVGRIRIFDSALACGCFFGLVLMLATWWLVLKHHPGEALGANLGRLGQFLPGYSVSWVGGLVGFAYLTLLGATAFACVGWLYNRIVSPPPPAAGVQGG